MVKHADELSLEEISNICNCFNITFSSANPLRFSLYRFPEEWIERFIAPLRSGRYQDVIVGLIKKEKRVIGTTILTLKRVNIQRERVIAGFFDDVAVHPRFQGRGLGKKVFGSVEAFLNESDALFGLLFTAYNGRAHRMYVKFGFKDLIHMRMLFRIVNRRLFSSLIARKIAKPLLYLIPKRKIPPFSNVIFQNLDEALKRYEEIGNLMALYDQVTEDMLRRVRVVAYKNDAIACGSIRLFTNINGSKIPVGIISNIVARKWNENVIDIISALAKKLSEYSVATIITHALEGDMLNCLKRAGFYIVPRKIVGMIKWIGKEIRINESNIYLPTEHIVGEF